MDAGCDRCGKKEGAYTGSYFTTERICDICRGREEQHPMFPIAKEVENYAVNKGDHNFPGIGLPIDLMVKIS